MSRDSRKWQWPIGFKRTGKCLGKEKSVTWENDNGQSDMWSAYEGGGDFKVSLSAPFPSSSCAMWHWINQQLMKRKFTTTCRMCFGATQNLRSVGETKVFQFLLFWQTKCPLQLYSGLSNSQRAWVKKKQLKCETSGRPGCYTNISVKLEENMTSFKRWDKKLKKKMKLVCAGSTGSICAVVRSVAG